MKLVTREREKKKTERETKREKTEPKFPKNLFCEHVTKEPQKTREEGTLPVGSGGLPA